MKFTLIASVLAALVAVPFAHADDPARGQQNDPTTDQSKDQTRDTSHDMPKDTSRDTSNYTVKDAKGLQPVDVKFDTDSARLKSDDDASIAAVADWAKCNPKAAIILEGHADPRGTQAHNMVLSAARAATVRQKLVDQGVRSDRIVISVYGKNGPQRATYADDRRVTVRPADAPVDAREVEAMR